MEASETQVVIVTGAGGGIGKAAVDQFARDGATVVAVDVDDEKVAVLAEEADQWPGEVAAVVGDVGTVEGVARYVDVAMEHGRIDVLFNNAGIYTVKRIADMTVDEFDREMQVNVRSQWLGLKHVLPHMVERRSGSVINCASVNGLQASPGTAAYTATKHAVIGLTRAAAVEVGPYGVRVNAICPAMVQTDMLRSFASDEELAKAIQELVPLGRACSADEQVNIVRFLASDAASYVNGAAIVIDGGLTTTFATDKEALLAAAQ
jgi:3alpha(or 20beta)-hydroxysteroid dehydrogenase